MFPFDDVIMTRGVPHCVYMGWGVVPDSKVHGANMGPIWGRQDPGGPHVGPMNLAIWGLKYENLTELQSAKLELFYGSTAK